MNPKIRASRTLFYALRILIAALLVAPALGGSAYIFWRLASSTYGICVRVDGQFELRSLSERAESARFRRAPQWTPDGDCIVFAETDYPETLYAARVNGTETELSPLGERTCRWHYAFSPAVSPDGSLIAYSDSRIRLVSLDGTERRAP